MFKDKVLEILEENRGNEISGVDIAGKLGVTRAAVCKAVKQLRRSGNAIISRNNGGYTLEENSAALSEIGIKNLLQKPIDVVYYPQTDSTNTRAKILALDKNVACALIVADSQTEGRGRRGRSFFSPKGSGVYFSIMFRPRLTYAECQRVVPMTAVAVSQAIENVCNQKTYIKWVNDLYYNGKKICGIATESIGELGEACPDALIVGIGINLNTVDFPDYIKDKAGALGVTVNRNALVAACVNSFFALFRDIDKNDFMDEYRKKCFILGQKVTVLTSPSFDALAESVDDDGKLIVVKSDATKIKLSTDEVSVLPENLKNNCR